jgi:hypothetical protein
MTEKNAIWAPIVPKPEPFWKTPLEMAEAYRSAEPRVSRSQRYSLVVTEVKPGPRRDGRDQRRRGHDGRLQDGP